MSAFIEPGSDTSEPNFADFLSSWAGLPTLRRDQLLDWHGLNHQVVYPVSALLAVASAAQLLADARSLMQLDSESPVDRSEESRTSDHRVVLGWPPSGRLALIQQELRAEPQTVRTVRSVDGDNQWRWEFPVCNAHGEVMNYVRVNAASEDDAIAAAALRIDRDRILGTGVVVRLAAQV